MKFLSIGHSTFDTFLKVDEASLQCSMDKTSCKICFDFGSKIPVRDVHYGVGGSAANVAVGVSRLGVPTSINTIIGNDMKGMDIISVLKRNKINMALLKADNNPTDQSSILSYHNDRTIFTYNHERLYRLKHEEVSHDYIFIGSTGQNVKALYEDIIYIKGHDSEKVLFYNPGSREIRTAREDIAELIPNIDYLIVNIEEGCAILDPSLKRHDIDIKDLAGLLQERGPKNVLITDGSVGAYGYDGYKFIFKPSRKVKVVEKTGAGDAFTSGFIAGIINGQDFAQAIEWGVENSAATIQSYGAQNGLLSKSEILSLLK